MPRVDVVENGVDTAYFLPSKAEREPARMLFLGSLDWRPNLDGVAAFARPRLPGGPGRRAGRDLVIVGRNPPDWLRRRAATTPGVELHGSVPDVRPFLADAA